MPVNSNTVAEVLTEEGTASLVDAVEGYVLGGLDDLAFAATDLPNFLADTSPIVAAGQPTRQILRAACRSYARGGGPQNLPGFDAVWGGICEPYLESIGENPLPGSLAAPFAGGQCPVDYFIIYGYRPINTDGSLGAEVQQPSITIPGPIRGIAVEGNIGALQLVVTYGAGLKATLRQSSAPQGDFAEPRIVQTVRLDGQPDSCGNPPVEYDPPKIRPDLPTLPPSTPIDFPGIGPIGVDVTFDPDGTININLPDIGVDVGIEDPFGFGGDGGGGTPPTGPPPGDVGQPGAPVSVGAGGDEEGVAPEGSVLVGLRVQVVAVPNSRNRYTDEVLRGAYYVYMGVPGLLDHDPAGAMVRADQFIFAEQPNLTAWRIRANTGYELITTPYYRQVEE